MQQPLASITNNPSATMAAVAAAVAAQQRSMPSSDSGFPSTAAAAAYFNVIASLANSSSLTGSSLGVAYPNSSVSLAEVVAALAASGLCSLPAHLSSNPPPISSGNLLPSFAFGNRASPSVSDSHQNRDTITALSSGNIHSNLPYHPNVMQSASMSKSSTVPLHHNPNLDFANSTLDTAKVCLAQLAAAAAAGNSNNTSGSHINQQTFLPSNQQFQKAHQILRSLNVSNPLISPLLSGNTADLDISQTTSTPSSTPISNSPLLPPAPISYRGSITTGQSAQQIQLQQQAHQKQHNTSKYMTQADYSSSRVPSTAQNIENPHLLTPNYPASITSAQGCLTSGGRHIENTSSRNSNTSASTLQFNPSSSLPSPGVITSLTSPNTPTVSSISNTGSSVALTAGLAPFAADLSSLNYLTSATLAAAFQQQQQQLNKLVPANNMPSSHGHSNTLGPSGPSNNNSSGRRFF
ncbi:Proteophosphoglycan 5 [Schistosoma japonicum]|uniref:Proteophosphoglycan 5 n=1 Tax=Schistosoma japonicum TaxID=6182 RepID=A0A4Z2DL69_SCHJA|nr:Proteophosphoglycan 5 [Schistosoma japonicum]